MGTILSQEEIDALLGVDQHAPTAPRCRRRGQRRRSSATTSGGRTACRSQIRSLHFLHDRFARNVSTSLSAYLRAVTDVSIVSVEQIASLAALVKDS